MDAEINVEDVAIIVNTSCVHEASLHSNKILLLYF